MAEQTKRRKPKQPRHPKLYAALSSLFLLLAVGLLVWLAVMRGGAVISVTGADASADLPVNVRLAGDFSKDHGLIRYPGAKAGVDVSSHQGEIDWQAVRSAGIDFAILRIGYRGYSLGSLNEDAGYRSNLSGAEAAGIDVGVYFFSQATSIDEAVEEADYVLSLLSGTELVYPVFFDWEEISDEESRTAGKATDDVSLYAAAFCQRIRAGGYEPGVYFNQQYGYTIMQLETLQDCVFWLAEYHSAPSFLYDVRFWQYTGTGQVDGIGTDVDLNLLFTD